MVYEAQSAPQLFGSALGCPSGSALPAVSAAAGAAGAAAVVATVTVVGKDAVTWRL